MDSAYVRDEWTCALDLDKPVHPVVRLGDVTQLPERVGLYDARLMQRDADYERELAKLVEQLQAAPPPLGALHAVPSLPPHFLERPEALRRLRDAVTAALEQRIVITGVASRVGVQGMGGIGKSVLAAALARNTRVRFLFPGGVYWVPLGQEPRLVELQRDLARALGDAGDFESPFTGQKRLRELLKEKQTLLVLDDLWHKEHAEAFDVLGPMCRMLITTRDAQLVTTFGGMPYQVQLLSDDEARRLLARWAGVEPDQLPAAAAEVVEQCGRLPLALSICGAMIRDRKPWADVVADLREAELEFVSHDLPNYPHKDVWKAIKIGIDALGRPEYGGRPEYRERFAELTVFPPDETVPEGAVSVLWLQTGGLKEVRARDLLRLLASKALVQLDADAQQGPDAPSRVSLHDLLYDFALRTAGEPRRLHEQLLEAYRKCCPDGWQDGPNDGYFFTHLRRHLIEAGRAGELADLLHELRWLEAKNEAGLTFDLTADYHEALSALPADDARRKMLRLLEEAIRHDIHFIARHAQDYPQALFQCLWNAGWWYDCPQSAAHYLEPEGSWSNSGPLCDRSEDKLSALLERWSMDKKQASPGFLWVQSFRPPPASLGTGQLAVLRGHEGYVESVSYSPDGQQIASASYDQTIRVWDAASGAELAVLRGHESYAHSVSYSPDGRRIASGSGDNTVRVWDARSGAELAVLRGHEGYVESVSYSPDGRRIASGSQDKTVRVWDADSGAELTVLRGHQNWLKSVSYSPDGQRIASASLDDTVRVWDAHSGAELAVLHGHEDSVYSVSYSPDGRRIASADDQTVRVWDAETFACLEIIPGAGDVIAIAAGARLFPWRALVQRLETVIEDAATGQVIARFPHPLEHISTHPPSRQWAGSAGNHVYLIALEGEP